MAHEPFWAGPLQASLALVGQALVGPPGTLWAGPFWASLGPRGPGSDGPRLGQALMGTLVNQGLGSMANPLNLLATLKWHKAIHVYTRIKRARFARAMAYEIISRDNITG